MMPVHSPFFLDIRQINHAMDAATLNMHRTVIRSTALIEESRDLMSRADAIIAAVASLFGKGPP